MSLKDMYHYAKIDPHNMMPMEFGTVSEYEWRDMKKDEQSRGRYIGFGFTMEQAIESLLYELDCVINLTNLKMLALRAAKDEVCNASLDHADASEFNAARRRVTA